MTYRAERVSAFHIVISDTRGVFEESTMFIFAESPLGLWEVRLAFEKSVGCSRFSSSFHVCILDLLWSRIKDVSHAERSDLTSTQLENHQIDKRLDL